GQTQKKCSWTPVRRQFVGHLDIPPEGDGSLGRPCPCCFHRNLATATSGGDCSVDRTVNQRGNLRRAGLSRILAETISCIHAQSVGRVVPASHALRNFPQLSGNRCVRQDR